ncbi:porin family protein [Acidobacteria bacterium ACD]|nr:MAG: hypothetical protein EDX89_01435 [Acidobacteriota bacterium]MCE7960375.1 hypothetical protein [Acidobacteria bacterium ACB2]MDL1950067.1 porin family protein [Acidobacteria bacterium ACD]
MKTTSKLAPLALLLALLAFAPAALAGGDGFSLDLGIHGGLVGVTDGDGQRFLGGAQVRVHLLWLIAAEGRASYYTDTVDVTTAQSIDIKNVPLQASLMIYPIKLPKFGVYVLGGGTYSSVRLEAEGPVQGTVTEKKWSAHAGAGVDVKLSGRVTLNGDVRFVFLDVQDAEGLGSALLENYQGDYWAGTIGVTFKLF